MTLNVRNYVSTSCFDRNQVHPGPPIFHCNGHETLRSTYFQYLVKL